MTIPSADLELQQLLREVRHIRVQSSRLIQGALSGGYRSVFRGSGIEFEEVREYAEGDDPRSVDWNVTARMGRPFVKRFVDERQLNLAFLLDLSASMECGFGAWSPRQMAARVCACLMLAAVQYDDRVAFLGYDQEVRRFESPQKGLSHVLRIVRDFLSLPASEGASDPAPALRLAAQALPAQSTVFLVSDFLGSGWQPTLQECAKRHEVIAVRLLAPELRKMPSGLWSMRNAVGQGRRLIDGDDPVVRAQYEERVERWDFETRQMLQQAGVAVLDVPIPQTADPDAVARPILRFFQRRQGRGRS
ncbi:MAG: DUF58 domain-containing protein [Planctomycetota bacterium]|nr:MAG: DUF58 domain-containing protein [Planctomycetota bacterium]